MRACSILLLLIALPALSQQMMPCSPAAHVDFKKQENSTSSATTGTYTSGSFTADTYDMPAAAGPAVQKALDLWADIIQSEITIRIAITWTDEITNQLANGQPSQYFKNFQDVPLTHVWYPVALAEKIHGRALNAADAPDITVQISGNQSWYYPTDGQPAADQFDFTTVLLHEIAHGLGFLSGATQSGESVSIFNDSDLVPYDLLLTNGPNATPLYMSGASADLTDLLTNQPVYLQTHCNEDYNEFRVFTSFPFLPSISLSHLDTSYQENQPVLMAPYFQPGTAFHEIDAPTRQVLCAVGWESNPSEQEVLVFPNPAWDQISIQVPSVLTHANLKVYNSAGIMVTEAVNLKANNGQINLDLTFLSSGVYFISLENPVEGFQNHQRIILH